MSSRVRYFCVMRRITAAAAALVLGSGIATSGCQMLIQSAPAEESSSPTATPEAASQEPLPPTAIPEPLETGLPDKSAEPLVTPTREVPPPRD